MPPRMGSGSEAKRAVNLPMVPRTSMMPAPYCTTRLLPTCQGAGGWGYIQEARWEGVSCGVGWAEPVVRGRLKWAGA